MVRTKQWDSYDTLGYSKSVTFLKHFPQKGLMALWPYCGCTGRAGLRQPSCRKSRMSARPRPTHYGVCVFVCPWAHVYFRLYFLPLLFTSTLLFFNIFIFLYFILIFYFYFLFYFFLFSIFFCSRSILGNSVRTRQRRFCYYFLSTFWTCSWGCLNSRNRFNSKSVVRQHIL